MSTGGVAPATAAAPANASAIMPSVALMPASGAANRKAVCQAPTPRPKRMFTKTKSRLAVEGAAPAPPTAEASSSGSGLQLLKSLGFGFKHATPFMLFISYFSTVNMYCFYLYYKLLSVATHVYLSDLYMY